jgi:site-specific recombinase XerD
MGRKLAAIKPFFNYMMENEGFGANPAAFIRSHKIT